MRKGDLAVSHAKRAADCTLRADKPLFDRLVHGETNAMSSILRGSMHIEGDAELFVLFQRLFPAEVRSRGVARKKSHRRAA
jgi:putative sterol carrier protein